MSTRFSEVEHFCRYLSFVLAKATPPLVLDQLLGSFCQNLLWRNGLVRLEAPYTLQARAGANGVANAAVLASPWILRAKDLKKPSRHIAAWIMTHKIKRRFQHTVNILYVGSCTLSDGAPLRIPHLAGP